MLADLGSPSAVELARALDVSTRQAARWQREDQAPRLAMLAIFWVTRWGRSQVEAQAVNEARIMAQLASARAREIGELQAELARLVAIGDFGAANAPRWA